ncbi:probable F420-dependent oxidoreductase, MSMEG_2516 family [Streptomyces sp. SceaMP-e96]|uniref:LLM class F420-dependent oxidoreductase n=1 Tax=unclassified Streptomyces TaxID=2593676 RepID=UPI000823E6DB|nr:MULTISPECIES: LLM class F420-dependent oxidoreductase [unclassified Streptomyces]MYT14751.1 TIGR03621 family F420-dependent LLM class oxidoreductase [Streptomyces sp. SID4951]SCK16239.1 probable F420-dependent oxidoreductase, MSMEG_2516 family [Streptomyces sp. SceaMP-e96]
MPLQRPFRFGVNMFVPGSRREWSAKCRRAEELGFDVVGVADHLEFSAPFPAMLLAAEMTERVRLSTFVLNTPFYNPVLLARDVASTDQFIDGRMELGLGAGYVKAEFDTAGIPFPSGGRRVEQLEQTVTTLRRLFEDTEYQPRPAQPSGPPLLIGGWGDRLLRLAAAHADIIALTGGWANTTGDVLQLAGAAQTEERVAYVRGLLGDRADTVELNLMVQQVIPPAERTAVPDRFEPLPPDAERSSEEPPSVLTGTPADMAQQIKERRERYGFTYFTVMEYNMENFAPVIAALR